MGELFFDFFLNLFNTIQIERIFIEGRRKAEKDILSRVLVQRKCQV